MIRNITDKYDFFIDQSRCIGCQACVQACAECDTHRGHSMIHLEYVDRPTGVQTAPVVCMHCEDPTCAKVCPADAIKKDSRGVVHTAAKPRCVSCANCALACPFGVPKMNTGYELMMKCDMCYDRTSVGKKPMCATVCPSDALYFGSKEEIERKRQETPVNEFQFGQQTVKTKVYMMTARKKNTLLVDIVNFMSGDSKHDPLERNRPGAPDAASSSIWDESLFADAPEPEPDTI